MATRVRFDRIDPAPFSIDIGTSEKLVLNMNGGNDSFSATGNLAALISVTVDGGAGDDSIRGSNGNDVLLGGDGNDFIDGQQGADVAFLGAGNDVFQWDPGDGSDVVEGQDGTDSMLFNGAATSETFDLSANGGRARFTRNVANITMDLNDVERVELNTLGGPDTFNDRRPVRHRRTRSRPSISPARRRHPRRRLDVIHRCDRPRRGGHDHAQQRWAPRRGHTVCRQAAHLERRCGERFTSDQHRRGQRQHQRHGTAGHRPASHDRCGRRQ